MVRMSKASLFMFILVPTDLKNKLSTWYVQTCYCFVFYFTFKGVTVLKIHCSVYTSVLEGQGLVCFQYSREKEKKNVENNIFVI